jgi:cellulose synthase/poly-beta-1,6-N-acetylglucosamine synthase-like glycosyltransferase
MNFRIAYEPTISVIIPARPGTEDLRALESLKVMNYPQNKIEILVVEGEKPSAQRNSAAKLASGEILFFLDDDSDADVDLFHFAVRSFQNPEVDIVGGPSVVVPEGCLIERAIGYVLSSYFAMANIRCRYRAIGRHEQTGTEQNLILCNMAVRKDAFLQENGLDHRLYPNEENEFINRMKTKGYLAIYNPKMVVSRPHRSSFPEFIKQMFRYGKGRLEHFLIQPSFFNPIYLLPVAFLGYLLSLPLAYYLLGLTSALLIYLLPLVIYIEGIAVTSLRILAEEHDWLAMLLIPWFFPTVHVSYAVGMVGAMLMRLFNISWPLPVSESNQLDVLRILFIKPLGMNTYPENPAQVDLVNLTPMEIMLRTSDSVVQ